MVVHRLGSMRAQNIPMISRSSGLPADAKQVSELLSS
jgi:hypothetical protein